MPIAYHPGMRAFAPIAAVTAAAALTAIVIGAGTASAAPVAPADNARWGGPAAAPLKVVFTPATRAPKVGVKWPYALEATVGGKPVKAKLTVTLLDPIGGVHAVEDDANDRVIKNRPFTGTYRDKLLFPAESKGFPLKLRFAVIAGKAKKTLEVEVTPK